MGIGNSLDRIYGQRILPGGILTGGQFKSRHDQRVTKSDLLPRLAIFIGTHHILQGIDPVGARSHVADGEATSVIRSGGSNKGSRRKSGIRQVRMHADSDARHRLQCSRIQQHTRNLQRINLITGGEGKREILQDVLLVVVGNRVGKVNRIGGLLTQRIL